ncbi:MAG TPA: ABC transporter ATP-binding protein [Ardenticatenaceae bacterium]|nr:ABC transporter ATP-binding protein [Ardenticatenaceae bacterium]
MARLLEVKDLETKFITPEGAVNAVNGVSLYLDEGETLGIVGESGSGKSVTMMTILRLIPMPPGKITNGEVIFEGRDLVKADDEEMREVRGNRIAIIFQDPMTSLNPVLTVEEQVSESLELHLGMSSEQARERSIQLLKMVGIPGAEKRVDNYPHQFSGGMRQRVMIAMGLSCNPQLLIADEPTTALDVTIQAQIVDLVRQLKENIGMAIIWITHDLGVLAGLAERVIVMYAGQIMEEGTVKDVYANPRNPYTIGLLQSIPRLDEKRKARLTPIEGLPPDLTNYPVGCPFAARCPFVLVKCVRELPPLMSVGSNHRSRCWVNPQGAQVLVESRAAAY